MEIWTLNIFAKLNYVLYRKQKLTIKNVVEISFNKHGCSNQKEISHNFLKSLENK